MHPMFLSLHCHMYLTLCQDLINLIEADYFVVQAIREQVQEQGSKTI